tara:strand:- start:84 stop:293 length:210 start_codon:yes stop_codon:yes gene_type:complete
MIKQKFFYNYTANKKNGYAKFAYGIMTTESDDGLDDMDLIDEVFEKVKSFAKERYPDADDINITSFNRV